MNRSVLRPRLALPLWEAGLGRRLLTAIAILAVTNMLGFWLSRWLAEGYVSLIFVLAVTLIGALMGPGVALLSAGLAAVTFDYFVSAPQWQFSMSEPRDLTAPLVFVVSALVSGLLSGRLKDVARNEKLHNMQLEALLEASGALQRANTVEEVADALAGFAVAQAGGGLALFDAGLVPVGPTAQQAGRAALQLAEHIMASGRDSLEEGALTAYALSGPHDMFGVLVAHRSSDTLGDRDFMLALARTTALAMERGMLAKRLAEAHGRARAEELKSALLSSVSHDFRTPLTVINTSAASLLAYGDHFDPDTSRDLLAGIVEESGRLNQLTTNLLQMTRLQGGTDSLSLNVLPVVEMVRAVVKRHERLYGFHKFAVDAPDGELLIVADATLFDLALSNLVQNACQYSEPGTQVRVTCAIKAEQCRIDVADQGMGIPPAVQAQVFDRFYRVERGMAAPRGTGLGLAIARGFVEAAGGTITLTSPIEGGRGTCMSIILPLAPRETEQTTP